jgi:hypothetical protein
MTSSSSHNNPPSQAPTQRGPANLSYDGPERGNEDEIEEGGGYGDPFFGEENDLFSSGKLL